MSDRAPGLLYSAVPVIALVVFLIGTVIIFRDDAVSGPAQVALFAAGAVAALMAMRLGFSWSELEKSVTRSVGYVTQTFLILLMVGALIGTWILGGIVPSLIYYGLDLLSPQFFLPASLVIASVIAFAAGSSWSTAGTIGIALMGIGNAMGMHPGMSAGAVISGAYFGDKMSPFSETTNLAASMVGVDLFSHIRHMLFTTGPGFIISLVLFTILSFSTDAGTYDSAGIEQVAVTIKANFNISPWLLLPMFLLLVMIGFKVAAIPALITGSLAGALCAVFFQADVINSFTGGSEHYIINAVAAVLKSAASGFTLESGLTDVDDLLTRGGMGSMLTTIWLILAAMFFSGIMEGSGMLQRLAAGIVSLATGNGRKSRGNLVAASLLTAFFTNMAAAEQYLSIVITGRMYDSAYRRAGLHPKNLSRVLEDAGTLTSPLVPWNTCGAFMAVTLGVSTMAYLPFAFLNLVNPLISLLYGYTGFSMEENDDESSE